MAGRWPPSFFEFLVHFFYGVKFCQTCLFSPANTVVVFFLERLGEEPDSGRARCEGLDACLPEPDDAPRAALSSGSAPSRHAAPDPPRQRLRPLTSPKSTLFKMQAAKAKAAAKQAAIKKKQGQPHSPPLPRPSFSRPACQPSASRTWPVSSWWSTPGVPSCGELVADRNELCIQPPLPLPPRPSSRPSRPPPPRRCPRRPRRWPPGIAHL